MFWLIQFIHCLIHLSIGILSMEIQAEDSSDIQGVLKIDEPVEFSPMMGKIPIRRMIERKR